LHAQREQDRPGPKFAARIPGAGEKRNTPLSRAKMKRGPGIPTDLCWISRHNLVIRIRKVNGIWANPRGCLSNHFTNAQNKGNFGELALLAAKRKRILPLLTAEFPLMTFTKMHERLRLELLSRIQRGTLSVSLLARQTGFGQSHISNFLNSHRNLSLEAMDRILAAQHLSTADLLQSEPRRRTGGEAIRHVPIVSHATALFEPLIRHSEVQARLHLAHAALESLRPRATQRRLKWERFVAIRVSLEDARAMDPVVLPEAVVLLDRHYTVLHRYRSERATLYAVRHEKQLKLRYIEVHSNRLVLRPQNHTFPVDVMELRPNELPGDNVVGRVALIVNEL
jgi:transcriptional regulator with XRE-family HTH domain